MQSAGLAHTVIGVQSTSKKTVKPQLSAIGAQVHLDQLLCAAHQRRARTGPMRAGKVVGRRVRRVVRSWPPRRRWQA